MQIQPIGNLQLKSGQTLKNVEIAYQVYGQLNPNRTNAVMICHALTGDVYPARYQGIKGWWEGLVGPGCAIDTEKFYVICSNVLGGCYGSTGPSSLNPDTDAPYGMDFPVINIGDMVKAQVELIKKLDINKLEAVIGGSMGGMQTLEWGRQEEIPVNKLIALAAPARVTPQAIAFNEVQRQAIMLDPLWRGGDYYGREIPANGLSVARMVGTITYRSEFSLEQKFGRKSAWRTGMAENPYERFADRFDVQSYLNYQGEALVRRFDPNSYLYLTKAMDLFDLSRGQGSLKEGLAKLQGRLSCVSVDTDILFPPFQQQEIVELRRAAGLETDYYELKSLHGHDAFLMDMDQLAPVIRKWMNAQP
jgi:homoserine O-acetyltransferase/O-succinyltransferase